MTSYQLVLATDLDGTFLEGNSEVKNYFYTKLLELRDQVLLIYTTGRPIETVKQFCQRGYLPYPHFVLGNHGTEIADGQHFQPVEVLQKPIAEKWNSGNERLRELLRNDRGIRLQPIDPLYRVAYYYDPEALQQETLEKITQAGFDFILSCDIYLDILPMDINKGTSLLQLIEHLGIDCEKVITAGDSLNDLSLFQTGLKSVAVGNSEPKLLEKVKGLGNAYCSTWPGLLGILDGLRFFGKFELFQGV